MRAINFYANTSEPSSGVVTVGYSTNAAHAVWLSHLSNSVVAQVDSRAKLEDVLPTAKAMSTEFKGSVKDFMEWLDTP